MNTGNKHDGIFAVQRMKGRRRCPKCGVEVSPNQELCACGHDLGRALRWKHLIAISAVLVIMTVLIGLALARAGWISWLTLAYFLSAFVVTLLFLWRRR